MVLILILLTVLKISGFFIYQIKAKESNNSGESIAKEANDDSMVLKDIFLLFLRIELKHLVKSSKIFCEYILYIFL